uniref:Uncharacterized protein n=1 Tax=Coccidioides posadasii RMSCC 3488 TaxID=454284 RepID=A0A0J6I7V2_COCPO|nr:hypothetical protein CPAG_03881 [Coccidioides posadasii RMSCC 3488]
MGHFAFNYGLQDRPEGLRNDDEHQEQMLFVDSGVFSQDIIQEVHLNMSLSALWKKASSLLQIQESAIGKVCRSTDAEVGLVSVSRGGGPRRFCRSQPHLVEKWSTRSVGIGAVTPFYKQNLTGDGVRRWQYGGGWY